MISIGNGSENLSTGQISNDDAKKLIRLATIGASRIELTEAMSSWEPDQAATGWRIIAAYFSTLGEVNPKIETGKALARYEFLMGQCVKIQDWKGALAAQKEIDKITTRLA
jgi:hypothetical protein